MGEIKKCPKCGNEMAFTIQWKGDFRYIVYFCKNCMEEYEEIG